MWFVVAGVVLLVLKLLGLGPVSGWAWWWVALPFALAALYWQIADSAGWTQRAAMRRADEKVKQRRDARLETLGLRPHRGGDGPHSRHRESANSQRSASPFPDARSPDIGKPPARWD